MIMPFFKITYYMVLVSVNLGDYCFLMCVCVFNKNVLPNFQIQPKDLGNTGSKNLVTSVYLEAVSPHFTKEKKMRVTYENGFLFIQTDKPIYTPDQSGEHVFFKNPAQYSVTILHCLNIFKNTVLWGHGGILRAGVIK